jgi:hypothetical protein
MSSLRRRRGFPGTLDTSFARAQLMDAARRSLPSLAAPPLPVGCLPHALFIEPPWEPTSERLVSQLDKLTVSERRGPQPRRTEPVTAFAVSTTTPERKAADTRQQSTALDRPLAGKRSARSGSWPTPDPIAAAQHEPVDVERLRHILERHENELNAAVITGVPRSLSRAARQASISALTARGAALTLPLPLPLPLPRAPASALSSIRAPAAIPASGVSLQAVRASRAIFANEDQRTPAHAIATADARVRAVLSRLMQRKRVEPKSNDRVLEPELRGSLASLAEAERTHSQSSTEARAPLAVQPGAASEPRSSRPHAAELRRMSQPTPAQAGRGELRSTTGMHTAAADAPKRNKGALQELLDKWPVLESTSATAIPSTSPGRPMMAATPEARATHAALTAQLPSSQFSQGLGAATGAGFSDLLDDLLLREARRHGLGREDL